MHLPLSWDDPATQLAIRKYMQSVRPDAPWCPSNIEFIRRINGLDSIDDVRRIVFDASYLVLGLGDVYLGAPVATPVDPRHRLVTTKYNPARTWTPENAVGIGGAYLCVYGMEGPGGYQFVGRTVQMWNTWRSTREFDPARRGCCASSIRSDSIRSARRNCSRSARLSRTAAIRCASKHRTSACATITPSSIPSKPRPPAFKRRQQAAFEAERERWAPPAADQFVAAAIERRTSRRRLDAVPEGCRPVCSPVTASVWNIAVESRPARRRPDRS